MVKLLMGDDIIQDEKFMSDNPLTVLGVTVTIAQGKISLWPEEIKTKKWLGQVNEALKTGKLTSNDAATMAGRLSFTTQSAFQKIGRAPLRPIFTHKYNPLPGGRVSTRLRKALTWWKQFLETPLKREVDLRSDKEHVHIFTDARSTPPRLAAVIEVDGQLQYTDIEPSPSQMQQLSVRNDDQIMGLEMMAAMLAIQTFPKQLRGKRVHIWIDNTAGQGAYNKGASRQEDHNGLCHALWHAAAELDMEVFATRVPSELNIADLPSREEYDDLIQRGAVWVPPRLRLTRQEFSIYSQPTKAKGSRPTQRRAHLRRKQRRFAGKPW
jgi:hypothetical protein